MDAGLMLPVEQALERLLALSNPLPAVTASLDTVAGCYLAHDVMAKRTQPDDSLSESAAGRPFPGTLSAGEAVRIFTGAYVPEGADCILIQENAQQSGAILTLIGDAPDRSGRYVRAAGSDFRAGDKILSAALYLTLVRSLWLRWLDMVHWK